MAARFYVLSRLRYFEGAPFYRVLRDASGSFVSQVGYRGAPSVDAAWITKRMSDETVRVLAPGNIRGTVAFGTNEVKGPRGNCTASACSLGFSVELFVNTADNARLDASDFSPFGTISSEGMRVIDKLYAEYGELADLCAGGDADPYCVADGHGGFRGVNLTRFIADGVAYTASQFPRLDTVQSVELV
jgi:Cyclophilin type peptidyl-prolyl cis-trans isomerase/CLD